MSVPTAVSDVCGFLMLPALAWTVSSLIVAGLMPARRRAALIGALVAFGVLVVCYPLWMTNTE